MALIVNTNLSSLNAQRNLGKSNSAIAKSLERLSSGLRINRAGDDAAGMAIANKLQFQVRGLNQAVRNVNDAVSLVQTAEGALNTITDILQRLRELAVQAASDTNTSSDRSTLKSEADQLVAELTRVANTSEFNGAALLDGTYSSKVIHAGANAGQTIAISLGDARGKSIGSRAEASADLADSVVNGVNANLALGAVKVAGVDVPATSSSDDQVSVLEMSSVGFAAAGTAAMGTNLTVTINGTTITASAITANTLAIATLGEFYTGLASAINAAGLSNVTALVINTSTGASAIFVLRASKGQDITLTGSVTAAGLSASGFASVLGFASYGSIIGTAAVTTYNGQSSALAKAAAINAVKNSSGVSATAKANVVTGSAAVSAFSLASGDLYINGVAIGAATVAASDSTGTLISAINAQTSSSGVTARSDTSGKLVLTASDGRNIAVTVKTASVATSLNLSGTSNGLSYVYRSGVQLNSQSNFSLNTGETTVDLGTVTDSQGSTLSGTTTVSVDSATFAVSLLTISTQSGADAAILTLDAALTKVNQVRSDIGAIQSRLEMTINNLQIASENQSSAESRIRDADFAMETTAFSRNQILVQAGTAILAQANTLPQAALTLISGR